MREKIEPQPKNGPPFQVHGLPDEVWCNERLGHRHGHGPMLFTWRRPRGWTGRPVLIDGVWYWESSDEALF